MQLTSLSGVAAAACAREEAGQRQAEQRQGTGVQEIAASQTIADGHAAIGVKTQHR